MRWWWNIYPMDTLYILTSLQSQKRSLQGKGSIRARQCDFEMTLHYMEYSCPFDKQEGQQPRTHTEC